MCPRAVSLLDTSCTYLFQILVHLWNIVLGGKIISSGSVSESFLDASTLLNRQNLNVYPFEISSTHTISREQFLFPNPLLYNFGIAPKNLNC